MTATYDPAEVERLVREAREDDARLPVGPWTARPAGYVHAPNPNGWHRDTTLCPVRVNTDDPRMTAAIARTRNNLRAMADQLEAARARIAELEAKLVDLQGRKLGNGDAWAEAASEATGMYDYQRKLHEAMKATIRSLLDTELPAGELRKAVGELVK